MEGFVKSTLPELTGVQKAAILLAELGPSYNENYDALYKALHLTEAETVKLRTAFTGLKPYLKIPPKDINEIYREEAVLEEALAFGQKKGIYDPSKNPPSKISSKKSDLADMVKNNPADVAKLLGAWLDK